MENTEANIQLDAHPGPPCASRSSQKERMFPRSCAQRIGNLVHGENDHTDTNRRWRQVPRWVPTFACGTACLSHRPDAAPYERRRPSPSTTPRAPQNNFHPPCVVPLDSGTHRRVSGQSPLKSTPQPLRLSSSKPVLSVVEGPRFGENRQSHPERGPRRRPRPGTELRKPNFRRRSDEGVALYQKSTFFCSSRFTENPGDILGAMENADNLNTSLRHSVENEEVDKAGDRPHPEAFELLVLESSLDSHVWHFEEPLEGSLDREQVAPGRQRMLSGDVFHLFGEVTLSGAFSDEPLWHSASAPPLARPLAREAA